MVNAVDFFAGAGGWDLAATRLGIDVGGVENMKEARATRDAAGLKTIHDDVWTFDVEAEWYEGQIASPPCQTFSRAGKGAGRKALDTVLNLVPKVELMSLNSLRRIGTELANDERTALVLTPLWFALNGTPRWLAWEQVPTVLPVWEACAEALRCHGWDTWTGLLHAEQYGVPQTRTRAFLIAQAQGYTSDPTFDPVAMPPKPTHSRYYSRTPRQLDMGVKPWVSLAEALEGRHAMRDDWKQQPVFCGAGATSELTAGQKPRTLDEPAHTITGSGTAAWREPLPEWAYRRPSTTIVGSFKPEIVASPGYRTTVSRQNAPDSVRITVAESGILQSFPADYPWQGAKGKQYLQSGNAVPPLLAEAVLAEVTA